MDGLSEQILQCLIIDGRASFRRIADVLGSSEQTVARRYRTMAETGRIRVQVGRSAFAASRRAWLVRIRCRPGSAGALAEALSERDDVRWVLLVSGGNEVICTADGPVETGGDGVLARLPRSGVVLEFTAQALLRPFAGSADEWTLFEPRLRASQVTALRAGVVTRSSRVGRLLPDDEPLLTALARDGRASISGLAHDTGWPRARVAARFDALLRDGALFVVTDFLPETFGYHASAVLTLTVPPGRIVPVCQALARHAQTGFVAATTGSAGVVALVICRTSEDLFDYVTAQVGKLPGVAHVDLIPILRRIKQSGSRVIEGRLE